MEDAVRRALDHEDFDLVDPARQDTHDLVMKTIEGGRAWKDTRDKELELLRSRRIEAMKSQQRDVGVRSVGAEAMVETIRLAKFVVVHVTNGCAECQRLDRALGALDDRARRGDSRFRDCAPVFLRLDSREAEGDLHDVDSDQLPALLTYRDGELVSSKLAARFGDDDEIEDYLDSVI